MKTGSTYICKNGLSVFITGRSPEGRYIAYNEKRDLSVTLDSRGKTGITKGSGWDVVREAE